MEFLSTEGPFTAFRLHARLAVVRQSNLIQGANNMRMTEQQKADYKLYRKECKFNGVEPARQDFLAGDIPSCVTFHMELKVCPDFCVNDQDLFLGMGCRGRGQFPFPGPSP